VALLRHPCGSTVRLSLIVEHLVPLALPLAWKEGSAEEDKLGVIEQDPGRSLGPE
jgi:hypothetical protein